METACSLVIVKEVLEIQKQYLLISILYITGDLFAIISKLCITDL